MPPKRKAKTASSTNKKLKTEGATQETKRVRYKQALLKQAEEFVQASKRIDLRAARKLWTHACDGPGVTENEYATLDRIIREKPMTRGARVYLDSLVTKHSSGTSMYKSINNVKYDRSCLDLAGHLAKDGSLSLSDAKQLWQDVLDGPGVTHVEKGTLEYVMQEFKMTEKATKFLRDSLVQTTIIGSEPSPPSTASSISTASSSSSAVSMTTAAANIAAAPLVSTSSSSSLPTAGSSTFGFGSTTSTGWHFGGFGSSGLVLPKKFEFSLGAKAFGLFVSDTHCFAAAESGVVFKLTLEGKLEAQYQLPDGVKCLVADHGFVFAGCNNGSLYDLTVAPRLVAELEDFKQILWLDIFNGVMAASDEGGNVALVDCEGETLWKKKSSGVDGWMVRVDETGIYHGHSEGITKYDISGTALWTTRTEGVLFGWQQGSHLYAGLVEPNAFSGEIAKRLRRAGAKSGQVVVSLMWNNADDLDLHVHTPSGAHIYYGQKKSSDGGELDVDMNAGYVSSTEPVENVFWKKAPAGQYRVSVINFSNKSHQPVTPYEVHIKVLGNTSVHRGEFKNNPTATGAFGLSNRQEQVVHTFNFEGAPLRPEDNLPQKCVLCVDKATGDILRTYDADSSVPSTSCSPDESVVFAAVPNAVKAFSAEDGKTPTWNLKTGGGNAMTMQATSDDRLYLLCGEKLICADISAESIAGALEGKTSSFVSLARDANAPTVTAPVSSTDIEIATDTSSGVIVFCVKQGSKLRVRPAAGQGYDQDKNVQFPRNIRADGARFLVDGLTICGSFYRVQGNIRRL